MKKLLLLPVAATLAIACQSEPQKAAETAAAAAPAAPAPVAAAPAAPAAPVAAQPAEQANATQLTQVADRTQVCMVNDQYMGRPQIPVNVEGKTYYGCCPMCKERIEKNAQFRQAVDPISKKTVDKSTAVIGMRADGNVLYFESAETLAQFNRG